MKYKIKNYVIDAKSPVEAVKIAKVVDSVKDRVPDEVVKKYQNLVDRAIVSYGRIGAGLYDDLDQAGLWVDDRSGKYIVKRKVEDSTKDADWSKARYKKFNKGDRIKFKTLNKYVRTGTVEKDEGPHVIVRTDDFNSLERVEKDNIYDVIVFDSSKDSDVDFLSEEEQKAISQYREAIHNTSNPELLELYRHILEEEIEHYNELENAKTEDSVKDTTWTFLKNYKNAEIYEGTMHELGFSLDKGKTIQNAKTTDLREVYDIIDNYIK